MMKISTPEAQRGMSLIEVLVALLVSAIGLFGALALIGTLLKGGDFSRRMTEASVLGQYKLEEFVAYKVACISATACGSPYTTSFPNASNDCSALATTGPSSAASALGENVDSTGKTWAGATQGTKFIRTWDACTPTGSTRRRIYVWVQWVDAVGTHTVTLSRERST